MAGRKRRKFTPEFKAETVRLTLVGGRSIGQVAADLDLNENNLRIHEMDEHPALGVLRVAWDGLSARGDIDVARDGKTPALQVSHRGTQVHVETGGHGAIDVDDRGTHLQPHRPPLLRGKRAQCRSRALLVVYLPTAKKKKWLPACTNGIRPKDADKIRPGEVLRLEALDLVQKLSQPVPEGFSTPAPWVREPDE